MYVPQFNKYGSLYPVLLSATDILVMYHRSVGNHIVHEDYVYTKLCKSAQKSKIKDFNSPTNEPLIVIDYWSKKIEEDFRICNPDNINISHKYTTQDVTNVMNIMLKHAKSMKQGMIGIQGKFIESENEKTINSKIPLPTFLHYKRCTHKS